MLEEELLNLSFVENNHISIFTTFAKQSMIIRLSNPINCNRSAAKISKVMGSTKYLTTAGRSHGMAKVLILYSREIGLCRPPTEE